MWRLAMVAAMLARPAFADSIDTIGVNARAQAILTAGDEVIFGPTIEVGRVWEGRWQLAFDAGATVGDSASHVFGLALLEGGMWLHPSPNLDLELGWRVGYSYIHLRYGVNLQALVLEPVLALSYRLDRCRAIRFEPVVASAFNSGVWQGALGPQVGIVWSW